MISTRRIQSMTNLWRISQRSRHKLQSHPHSSAALFCILLATLSFLSQSPTSTDALLYEQQQHPAGRTNASLQCPTGWVQQGPKCYKLSYSPRNYEVARQRCSDLLAQLAYIEDETPRDEESLSNQHHQNHQQQNSSILSYLINSKKQEVITRTFYIQISPDLMKQYKMRQQSENTTATSLEYEHLDEYHSSEQSDLWIPKDDPNPHFATIRFNGSSIGETPSFVLAYSQHYGKWGLIPTSASRKAAYICERPLSLSPAAHHQHHSYAHPVPGTQHHSTHHQQHQNISPKTSSPDMTAYNSNPAPSYQAPPSQQPSSNNNAQQAPQPSHTKQADQTERDSASSSTVMNPPADVSSSALFREFPTSQSTILGSTAEMRCSPIESDSSIVWTFNGKNLTMSNRIRIQSSGWLRIEHARNSDGGNYTCTIQSGGMTESKTARLEIIERPHQPEYITAELLDKLSTSVRIKWTPGFNGNSPITSYTIEMRTVNSDNVENELLQSSNQSWEVAKVNITADQTSVIIPDLKPARKYIFRIKATNRVGVGDPSLPTRDPIEVPVQPPSMAPENLIGTPRSSTSISLQWSPPPKDAQNGLIKGYKIRHKLAGYASDSWYTNDVSETSHLNYVLEDLITWQNYEIQIAAENDKGVGPFSSSVFVRTKEGKPDHGPRSVLAEAISSRVIKISWNPPPAQHMNGINLGYRVQVWSDVAQAQLVKEVVVNHNSVTPLQTVTIDDLLPYTDYYITVKCFTSAGDGVPQEEMISAKTKQDFPEAVPVLEFADVLDKTLRVIWRPPIRINGELSQYTLEYSELASSDKRILKKFPPTMTETRIEDLMPQTRYTFKIYAHTDIGQGPGRTANITTSVPPVLPEPPSHLVPTNIGPYWVTIQFEPGFDGNAGIERWIAEALTSSPVEHRPTSWQHIYTSTNHTPSGNVVTIRNLRPFTRYKIRLTPANVVGSARYASEPTSEFRTSQIEPEQAPRDFTIDEVRSNSVVAHWSPLSNNLWLGQPKGYNLTWYESNNSTVMSQLINETRADSFMVRDLEEFTEYTFRIFAVNEAGPSPPSDPPITITTLEDVPSAGPTNLTAHASSSRTISVDWNGIPKRHRNGIVRGYKIQYQAVPDAPLQYRTIEDNTTKHVTLNDLKPFTTYHLAVAAFTSVGDGVYSPVISVQTSEDAPGIPQNLSSPTVSQNTVRILWDPPEDANGKILGYKVSYHSITEGSKDGASHELHQNERTFKATNLKPDTHYVFTVTAKTSQGWGQQASAILFTHDSELRANLPFYKESWFVILCACSSIVVTIIVTALLFIQTKSYKYKQDAIKQSTSQDRLGDAGFSIDDDPVNHYNNGFNLLSNHSANHRRSNGALSQSTANFTLPKTPPRPNPGSVVYSDDDDGGDDDVFEDVVEKRPVKSIAGTSQYDDGSGDSLTEKPSEISSSPAPESESADDEYYNIANKHFVNHYANVNGGGTLRSQKSWRKNGAGSGFTTKPHQTYGSASTSSSSRHRTKPKLPQRPAPSVPQVPTDHSQTSSDNNGSGQQQPVAGSSGMQLQQQHQPQSSRPDYGGPQQQQQQQHLQSSQMQPFPQTTSTLRNNGTMAATPPMNTPATAVAPPQASQQVPQVNGIATAQFVNNSNNSSNNENSYRPDQIQQQQHQQTNIDQADLLNNIVSLNGGRIIVNNMAGSRAPLPGFTSFV